MACIAGQPGLSDLLFELVVGINRREIECAPRTRVESRLHREWVECAHAVGKRDRISVAIPWNFCTTICLQRGQELAHAFQSAIQFGYRSGVRNPNVLARAESLAGDRRQMRLTKQLAGEIGSRFDSAASDER